MLTVLKTIKFPSGAAFEGSEDCSFIYRNAMWMKNYDISDIEWTPVDILSISNPITYAGDKIQYEITFSSNVSTKSYIHINAGAEWLLSTGAGGLEPEEIERLSVYGVFDSILDKIIIGVNGTERSVREWQEMDPNPANYPACVFNIHYNQQSGLNSMQILWCGKRIPEGGTVDSENQPLCPSLTDKISITFKKGFRTPAFYEVQEDITYEFSGKSGDKFQRKAVEKIYDTVTFDSVFYNGEQIAPNGKINLPTGVTAMDKNLFTVIFKEGSGIAYEITGITDMKNGENKITVTARSGSASATFVFTAVCTSKEEGKGCGSCGGAVGSEVIYSLAVIIFAAVYVKKRG